MKLFWLVAFSWTTSRVGYSAKQKSAVERVGDEGEVDQDGGTASFSNSSSIYTFL